MTDAIVGALVQVPLVAGGVLLASGRRGDDAAAPVAISTGVLVGVLAVAAAALRPAWEMPFLPGLPFALAVDGLSGVLVLTVAAVTLAVLIFANGDMGAGEARSRFFGLMLLFAGAMLVAVTSASLLPLLMAWEVMGATSYALIGFWWHEERRASAATLSFVTTRGADLGFYLAVAAAYAGSGSLNVNDLADLPAPYVHVVAAGLVVAAAGKSAQLPFSFWLSRAMEGPSPVSALLHSATMVAAGSFLLLRVEPLLRTTGWALPAAAGIGAATAVLLGLVAIWQRDVKQLLAASTSAQMGFMFVAVGSGSVVAGTAHLVAHAATKSLLFLVAGAWLTALGTKQLTELRGAARRTRTIAVPFALGALSLAGVPPLAMWVSKDEVLAAAWSASPLLWLAMLVAAALSAVYAGLLLGVAFARERGARARVGAPGFVALATLGAAVVALGGLALVEQPAALWLLVVASLLAVAVVTAVAVRTAHGRVPAAKPGLRSWLAGWLDLEKAARVVAARPLLRLAEALARFDDRVVDGSVHAAARGLVQVPAGCGAGSRNP